VPRRAVPRRPLAGAAVVLPLRSLPGLALAIVLPAGVAAGARIASGALRVHPVAGVLAASAIAFVVAAVMLRVFHRGSLRHAPGKPPASIERERLAAVTAREVARSLEDLVSVRSGAGAAELVALMRRTGRRWIPLSSGCLAECAGAVPLKHLILPRETPGAASALAVAMPRVAASTDGVALLEALRPGAPPALVEDEGRIIGFVTRHDVAEAALGPLPAGRLGERPAWSARGAAAIVRGDVALAEVRRRFGLPDGGAEGSLAAALRAHLGRALAPGESAEWGGLRFSVEETVGREPVRFRIERGTGR